MHFPLIATIATFASSAMGHGIVLSPPPRAVGPASTAACGQSITSAIEADNQTNIEVLYALGAADSAYNASRCRLAVCKGLQLDDNIDNVQVYTAGEEVTLQVWTRIPHRGWASVAIVDTASERLVGAKQLARFETDSASGYATGKMVRGRPDYEVKVTMPKLFPRCRVPGECVLEWTWFGRVVHHIYESCIDFVMVDEPYLVTRPQADMIVAKLQPVEQTSLWKKLLNFFRT